MAEEGGVGGLQGSEEQRGEAVRARPSQARWRLWRHRPRAAACFLAFSLRSAMLEFLLVVLAAAAAATTEAAEAESAASVASGSPKGGAGNIIYGACAARCGCRWWCACATALSSCSCA